MDASVRGTARKTSSRAMWVVSTPGAPPRPVRVCDREIYVARDQGGQRFTGYRSTGRTVGPDADALAGRAASPGWVVPSRRCLGAITWPTAGGAVVVG